MILSDWRGSKYLVLEEMNIVRASRPAQVTHLCAIASKFCAPVSRLSARDSKVRVADTESLRLIASTCDAATKSEGHELSRVSGVDFRHRAVDVRSDWEPC